MVCKVSVSLWTLIYGNEVKMQEGFSPGHLLEEGGHLLTGWKALYMNIWRMLVYFSSSSVEQCKGLVIAYPKYPNSVKDLCKECAGWCCSLEEVIWIIDTFCLFSGDKHAPTSPHLLKAERPFWVWFESWICHPLSITLGKVCNSSLPQFPYW